MTQDQLNIQSLHRVCARLIGARTALVNQLRGILFDRGIIIPMGVPSPIAGRVRSFRRHPV
ncbi:hypothetical protein MPC4_110156 [Methylocella tundrae]|uniref:Transposase n=1 Tax=Methylocella tundrae TaxID=227605 RepID=A0A4V6INB0_METTU|nr:protein of unknown function [Methylocella tundrae]VTZ48856.1 hypothetical protein MPC4_110156 [Methylocella tundrae]